jgi:hypothetical protein
MTSNKPTDPQSQFKKCAHHVQSPSYAANMRQHDEIMASAGDRVLAADINNPFNITVVFHFLAPNGTYDKERVMSRANEIIMSLNDDFNNYSANPNTMNNFRYKSIVNQIFMSNMPKQNTYLGQSYLNFVPKMPSNITFDLGQIYYYPVRNRLSLSQYDDVKDLEIEQQVIKQYIHQNRADAISPENFLNVWVIDMTDTNNLGYASFPWEMLDNYHGIVINRRAFFPEDYGETNFGNYKTFTHQVGHYLGLLHVYNQDSANGAPPSTNINADTEFVPMASTDPNTPTPSYDPTDRTSNANLQSDPQYNPLFMNFMDYTYDRYVTMFTDNQLRKMRYMLNTYRPRLNSLTNNAQLPVPKYNPDTDTFVGTIGTRSNVSTRNPPLIPARETVPNPRLSAQGSIAYVAQQPQIPQEVIQPQASQPATPTMTNDMINRLIPNLCGGNTQQNPNLTTRDQILANIQSMLPQDSMTPQIAQPVVQRSNQTPVDPISQYQSYNSTNGYASSYPYDPYSAQEYHRYMQSQPQAEMMQQPMFTMYPENGSMSTMQPATTQSMPQQMMPQMVSMQTTTPQMQPVQRQVVQPGMMQPGVSQTVAVQANMMRPATMQQPTVMQQTMQQSMMQQPMMQQTMQQPMQPTMMQQPMRQMVNGTNNGATNQRDKRIDPQMNRSATGTKPTSNATGNDDAGNLMINQEAVANLMNSRASQRNNQVRPQNINANSQINTTPVYMDGKPPLPAPSVLADRMTKVDEQLKNIKASMTATGPSTAQVVAQANKTTNLTRPSNFGQNVNGNVPGQTIPQPNPRAASAPNGRVPQNRFSRSKPANFN